MNQAFVCQGCLREEPSFAVAGSVNAVNHVEPIVALDQTGLGGELVARWRRLCAENTAFCGWLGCVGGLAMSKIHSEEDLLEAALASPGPLALGLSYGRLADLLAFRPKATCVAYPFLLSSSRSPDHRAAIESVLWRGGTHIDAAEALHAGFIESMTLAHSRELRSVLVEQALAAPTHFLLGQLTSWLITNILASDNQPDLDVIAFMSAACAKRSAASAPVIGQSK